MPTGDKLRLELKRQFNRQKSAYTAWARTGKLPTKDTGDGLPDQAPTPEDLGEGGGSMVEAMTPLLALVWQAEIQQFAPTVGLDPDDWSVTNPKIADAIKAQAIAFCESTNATTAKAVADALAEVKSELAAGLLAGDGTPELVARIKAIFETMGTSKARTIATTEASRAVHEAEQILGRASGVVRGWKWLLSSDACPMCQTIARRCPEVQDGTPFAIIGDDPTYSRIDHPPAHPRCQCSLVPVLDVDDEPLWSHTLVQPVPEAQDYPDGEAPADAA